MQGLAQDVFIVVTPSAPMPDDKRLIPVEPLFNMLLVVVAYVIASAEVIENVCRGLVLYPYSVGQLAKSSMLASAVNVLQLTVLSTLTAMVIGSV